MTNAELFNGVVESFLAVCHKNRIEGADLRAVAQDLNKTLTLSVRFGCLESEHPTEGEMNDTLAAVRRASTLTHLTKILTLLRMAQSLLTAQTNGSEYRCRLALDIAASWLSVN